MHVCKLGDVISPADAGVLLEVIDEKLAEARDTLTLHENDDPSRDNDTVAEAVSRYAELIGMSHERINVLERFARMLKEVM